MTDSDVVREALRLLRELEDLRVLRLQGLQMEVRLGLDQIETGRTKPLGAAAIQSKARRATG
jgi:antitoxin ParD1/3/4